MSFSKLHRPCFIDLPKFSSRTSAIYQFYDIPDNVDTLGYYTCFTCYELFEAPVVRENLIEHLKCHQCTCERYLDLNHSFLDRKYNYSKLVQNDERKSNDLKLSVGIIHDDGNLIIRFPKSRVARRRYTAYRNAQNSDRWSNFIAEEY